MTIGLEVERDELARRIIARTAQMWESGGPDEARAALAGDLSEQAAQLIGLRETEQGLERDDWIESVVVRTRQYARRQRIWMRKIPGLISVEADRPVAELTTDIVNRVATR